MAGSDRGLSIRGLEAVHDLVVGGELCTCLLRLEIMQCVGPAALTHGIVLCNLRRRNAAGQIGNGLVTVSLHYADEKIRASGREQMATVARNNSAEIILEVEKWLSERRGDWPRDETRVVRTEHSNYDTLFSACTRSNIDVAHLMAPVLSTLRSCPFPPEAHVKPTLVPFGPFS